MAIQQGTWAIWKRSSPRIAASFWAQRAILQAVLATLRDAAPIGHGTPFDDQLPPAQERALRAMAQLDEGRQQAVAEMAEALALRTGTRG